MRIQSLGTTIELEMGLDLKRNYWKFNKKMPKTEPLNLPIFGGQSEEEGQQII